MKIKKHFIAIAFAFMCVFSGCASANDYAETNVIQEMSSPTPQAYEIEPGETKYFITLNVSQSHFTLNLSQHMKDAMNSVDIEIMVDKDYYDSLEIGDSVNDDFRWGSFISSGSIGSWDITVSDKREVTGQ